MTFYLVVMLLSKYCNTILSMWQDNDICGHNIIQSFARKWTAKLVSSLVR